MGLEVESSTPLILVCDVCCFFVRAKRRCVRVLAAEDRCAERISRDVMQMTERTKLCLCNAVEVGVVWSVVMGKDRGSQVH